MLSNKFQYSKTQSQFTKELVLLEASFLSAATTQWVWMKFFFPTTSPASSLMTKKKCFTSEQGLLYALKEKQQTIEDAVQKWEYFKNKHTNNAWHCGSVQYKGIIQWTNGNMGLSIVQTMKNHLLYTEPIWSVQGVACCRLKAGSWCNQVWLDMHPTHKMHQ